MRRRFPPSNRITMFLQKSILSSSTTALEATSKEMLKFNKRSQEVCWWERDQMASVSTVSGVGAAPVAPWFALLLQMFGENVISSHRAGATSFALLALRFSLLPPLCVIAHRINSDKMVINISPPLLKRRGDRIQKKTLPEQPSCQEEVFFNQPT